MPGPEGHGSPPRLLWPGTESAGLQTAEICTWTEEPVFGAGQDPFARFQTAFQICENRTGPDRRGAESRTGPDRTGMETRTGPDRTGPADVARTGIFGPSEDPGPGETGPGCHQEPAWTEGLCSC